MFQTKFLDLNSHVWLFCMYCNPFSRKMKKKIDPIFYMISGLCWGNKGKGKGSPYNRPRRPRG